MEREEAIKHLSDLIHPVVLSESPGLMVYLTPKQRCILIHNIIRWDLPTDHFRFDRGKLLAINRPYTVPKMSSDSAQRLRQGAEDE